MPSETVYFPDKMYRELESMVSDGDADNFSQAVQQSIGVGDE